MKKYFALFIALIMLIAVAASVSAEVVEVEITEVITAVTVPKFKDVPDDHWAASAVYDLVKLGVTKGYPDGTFRGNKPITRYETAVLISKLAQVVGGEKIQADLKALKKDVAALKKGGSGGLLSGAYQANWQFGNLLAEAGGTRGGVANYRLKLSTARDLGNGASVNVNLDTMDYGWYNSSQTAGVLSTQLLDVESKIKLDLAVLGLPDPVEVVATYGPGNVMHTDTSGNVFPSETGVTFMRPDTGVRGYTSLWGMDVSGGYAALGQATSGRITTSILRGTAGKNLEGVPLVNTMRVDAVADYISSGMFSSSSRDIRGAVSVVAPLSDKVEAGGTFGMGGTQRQNMMVAGEVALNDLWDTGTVAVVRASKIGSDYLADNFAAAEWDFAGFDSFDRALLEGTVNIGGEVAQAVSDDVMLVGKGELRLNSDYKYEAPNGTITAQGGVSYAVAPNTSVDAFYRVFQSKATNDTSDVAALGLLYNF